MQVKTDFEDKLGELRNDISRRVQQVFTKSEPRSLYEPMHYAATSGGKLLRPILLLLACEATGGKAENALDAAVALEFVHNFTLVHDDILDDAALRRRVETIHRRWGERAAVLLGDYIYSHAFHLSTQVPGMAEILSGLQAGEKVASAATFLIDSEARLKGVVK